MNEKRVHSATEKSNSKFGKWQLIDRELCYSRSILALRSNENPLPKQVTAPSASTTLSTSFRQISTNVRSLHERTPYATTMTEFNPPNFHEISSRSFRGERRIVWVLASRAKLSPASCRMSKSNIVAVPPRLDWTLDLI